MEPADDTRDADAARGVEVERERTHALLDYLQEAADQLEVVNRIVSAVNASRTIEEVFSLASEQMRSLLSFDRASIALREADGEHLRVFALSGEKAGPLVVGALGRLRGSVTETALAERRMIVIAELREETRFNAYDDLREEGFRSAVCVPLFSSDRAVGSLNLTSRAPDSYGRKHLLALERLAPPLAIAIEKVLLLEETARLFEASRDRNEELRGLFEISRTFSTLTDTSEISGRLSRSIAKLVGGAMCLIATYDRRHNSVRAEPHGYHTPPDLIREFRFTLDHESESAPIYQTGEAFLSNQPASDARLNRKFIERWGVASAICVPMKIKRELIGFIYVANRAGGFSERDLRLLEIFAVQAAETIVNARLFLTIQAQAEREAVVNRLLLSLQRSGEPREKVRAVIERIGEVLELDRCIAVLFADGEHEDYYGEWCADGVEAVTEWPDVRERSPIRYALDTARRPLYASDVREHPLAAGIADLIELLNLKSLLVVPIMHLGRVIGSISAHQTRQHREWAEDDMDLMMAVATHVGATLENARLIAELREANRLKDEFLATLSHELRTPLTAITGWVDLLGESKSLSLDRDFADGVEAIRASANSLTQLISDLLDLSRIQRGVLRLDRQFFDINGIVSNAARNVRQAATARRLDLKLELSDELPPIVADPQRVQQVLWNLITNAIKFTPAGGSVTVRTRLRGAERAGDADTRTTGLGEWIEIEVEDTGEGIAPEFLPFIWDRFRQADSSATRRHGGLGIGLSLVKELIEAHGGGVEAFSDGRRGAIFTVRLPIVADDEWFEGEPRFESGRAGGVDGVEPV
ncbi:MAG: GAF domain-containing protein [Pyrinomonadaceae bacterium]